VVAVVDAPLCTSWPEARHHQIRVFGSAGDNERGGSVRKYSWGVGAGCAPKGAGATIFDFNFGLRPKFFLGVGREGGTG
jgi:hypothetical protein